MKQINLILASLFFATSMSLFQPLNGGQQSIIIGNMFKPSLRWGGNMDDYTKSFVVGLVGFIASLSTEYIAKNIRNADTNPTKQQLVAETLKIVATVGVGEAGGLAIALGETLYSLPTEQVLPLTKLSVYMITTLFMQGLLSQ